MNETATSVLRVGTAGWSYPDWEGIVYPAPRPRNKHPLEYLSAWFDMVEVNSTFYYPPNARYCASWLKKVAANPNFRFTLKLWERFTHKRGAWPDARDVRAVVDGMKPLHEAGILGALLAQFPWSFRRTPENREWLGRIADTFAGYPIAVELRHASWEREEVFEQFRARGIAFCNIDQPLFEESIAPSARCTASFAYARLHGRNYANWFREDAGRDARYDYLYSEEELRPWLERLRALRDMAPEVYVVTNNHFEGQAVANALEIQGALGAAPRDLPQQLLARFPRLEALAAKKV